MLPKGKVLERRRRAASLEREGDPSGELTFTNVTAGTSTRNAGRSTPSRNLFEDRGVCIALRGLYHTSDVSHTNCIKFLLSTSEIFLS